jgi:hypothetical protein
MPVFIVSDFEKQTANPSKGLRSALTFIINLSKFMGAKNTVNIKLFTSLIFLCYSITYRWYVCMLVNVIASSLVLFL